MFAAIKGTIIKAVLYGTLDDVYPKWLHEEVLDGVYEDNTGTINYVLSDENDDEFKWTTLEPYETVILKNKYGDICTTLVDTFEKLYMELGSFIAALKEDCVEYFILKNDTRWQEIPEWIRERIDSDGVIWEYNDVKWWCGAEELYGPRVKPTCIFIRNRKGQVRYMEVDEFEKFFDAPENPEYYKNIYKED